MKQKTVFLCNECGYESPKWYGKCPSCGAWNSMDEFKEAKAAAAPRGVLPKTRENAIGRWKSEKLKPTKKRAFALAFQNWIVYWAAAQCMAALCWSAANRALENLHCCCKCVRR